MFDDSIIVEYDAIPHSHSINSLHNTYCHFIFHIVLIAIALLYFIDI